MGYVAEVRGSRRGEGDDDLWAASDPCATLDEAVAQVDAILSRRGGALSDWAWAGVVDEGGAIVHERRNPRARDASRDDAADRSEFAIQQGMGHGVGAYNEVNGDDVEEPPAPGFR